MALGDGVRRDVALISDAERALLLQAFLQLDTAKFFGDGVSYWDKQEQIHKTAHLSGADVHLGPGFVPWHREIVNRLEQLLREVNPDLSLHYWNWTVDPRSTAGGRAALFTPTFMGSAQGDAGAPLADFESSENAELGNGHTHIWRHMNNGNNALGNPVSVSDAAIVGAGDWTAFNDLIQQAHSDAHLYVGGTIRQSHYSFHDPFVFLLHSNVDRLYAMWQTQAGHPERLNPTTVYGADSGDPGLNGPVEPWAGNAANPALRLRPWAPPESQQVPKTYKHPSVVAPPCYDTVPHVSLVEVGNAGPLGDGSWAVTFNDVPAGEGASRAAVFRVYACDAVTFRVKPGSEPAAPYFTLSSGGSVTAAHARTPYVEARLWFGFTGGAPDTAAPVGHVVVHCDQTNQDFAFTLTGNTIARPTVAVMLALDQSGSMDDPAGTTGARRIELLKEAAGRFGQVIQPGNGAGLVRFDTDAYPVADPTFPGLAVTRIGPGGDADPGRVGLLQAINRHATNPAGATSIGDGVVMARNVLSAVPGADYQQKALIVFTDGLENTPASIDSVSGSIDQRTFAIGLGSETQVSASALRKLAHNTGGYLLLTGDLTPGSDDYFRLSKYFLQILAGVTNTSIVLDPSGYLPPGATVRVPFTLTEFDIDATVVLMVDVPAIAMSLETPAGDVLDEAAVTALGGTVGHGPTTTSFRLGLPAPVGAGAHGGTWYAVLEVDEKRLNRELGHRKDDRGFRSRAAAHGVRYSLSVYSWSNVRMDARLDQASIEPGAALTFRAELREFGMPIEQRARVVATVTAPSGAVATVGMVETEPGVFSGASVAPVPGVYPVRIVAEGQTLRGEPFTREATFTGVALEGGDRPTAPLPGDPRGAEVDLCKLLSCLLQPEVAGRFLERHEVDVSRLAECVELLCRRAAPDVAEPRGGGEGDR